jgi:PAS domain S-box-containing protein
MHFFADKLAVINKFRRFLAAEDYFFTKLLGSTALGVLSILLVASILLTMTFYNHRQNQLGLQGLEITRSLNQIDSDLAAIEMLHHNFLLTGKESYATPFEKRKVALQARLDDLSARFVADPVQRKRALLLGSDVRLWLKNVAQPQFQSRIPTTKTSPRQSMATEDEIQTAEQGNSLLAEARQNLDAIRQFEEISQEFRVRDYRQINRSYRALAFTPKLESRVSEIEKAEVDFLLTGKDSSLETFNRTLDEFHQIAGYLAELMTNNPGQSALLKEISAGMEQWLREEARPEIKAKIEKRDPQSIMAIGQGKKTMGLMRASIDELERAQDGISSRARIYGILENIAETGAVVLVCLLAIAVLIASSLYSFRSYHDHLQRIAQAEEANRAITAETHSIIETSLDAILIIDNQGLLQSMNQSGERMFGFPVKELLGKSISKIIPQRLFLHDMTSLGRGTIMAVGHHHDQYTFPIEISLNKVNVSGRNQYVASIRDISDRKRSEETLKHIGISVSAHTGGEFLRTLVKQLCKALQADFAFIVESIKRGDQTTNTLIISSKDEIRSEFNYDLAGSACEEARKGFRAYPCDVCKEFPDDHVLRELDAESFVAMNLRDHDGHSVGVMGVIDRKAMENIPMAESTLQIFSARAASEIERKRFEEDLAAEKERLAVTLRSIGDGFIATDVDGNVLLLNSVTERLTGWSQSRAMGRPLADVFQIVHERTRVPALDIINVIVKTGSLGDYPNRALILSQTGVERLIETSVAPIRDRGARKLGVVLAFRDITEKERLEGERRKTEKLESLGVAAGGIAHDFNNLLTSILGNLSLSLMESGSNDKLTNYLTTAKRASLRAQDLSQQLLTFAKGGAPVKKIASVGQLIEDTVTFSLRGGKIRSVISVPGDLWPVEIDAGQISQVIGNLTINAEQAMPQGGTIQVTCENITDLPATPLLANLAPGKFIKIVIKDEGVGIPEEYIKKIFDPYFTTKAKGSGLGLATAYSIVTKHGGAITVDSKTNAGTTFTIYLPASDKAVDTDTAYPRELVGGHGRVLILDDEEEICSLVTNALTPLGYEVVEARDGAEAVGLYKDALIEGRCFDVVISDLTIPGGMGGQEAIRHLLEIDPEVKAIVSSGYANDTILSRYRDYGFLARLTKPYEVTDLSHVVKDVINSLETPQITVL